MAYTVDRVVICDAYQEPERHYRLLPGGRSELVDGRRPSMRFLASAKDAKSGIAGVVGRETALFDDLGAAGEERNEFVNDLRGEVRSWREAGYPGTAVVTRRLLEWWFERDEERRAVGKRLFFCQQEAVETLFHLYEVQRRHRMPGTGDLLRYALKLATGAGKTVVMATVVVWSTLHKRKVSGSSLSANFLVLVPNLTVRDRVSGAPRGDGLDPAGERNLYDEFEMVPPEYRDEFQPNVLVRNWQAVPLDAKRDDWIGEGEVPVEDGRFVPQSVLRAMRRRARQDPNAPIRRLLKGWRDLVVFNDEAHHVYGEKRTKRGEEPAYIRWSHILDRITKSSRLALVVDLSATPWYGSGSPKPEGTLFEWLVSDFSVYDAFESGLVKVVRLPDPTEQGSIYIDLWDPVRGAKTKEEYLIACRGAVASIYSSWKQDYEDWAQTLPELRGPSPVLLCVTNDATRAKWLFEHLVRDYDLLRNEGDDRSRWTTIQIDSKVFDADRGREAVLREMVNTVGSPNRPGEHVRCIVSVNMLSEGWDVKSVTHILGLRAFGSPLLTEQIVGRGLRRTNYDVLNQPLDQRPEGYEETVDAFGIPFVGFPVQRRKRPPTGQWGQKPVWIEPVGTEGGVPRARAQRALVGGRGDRAAGGSDSGGQPAADRDRPEADTPGRECEAGGRWPARGDPDARSVSSRVALAAYRVSGGAGSPRSRQPWRCVGARRGAHVRRTAGPGAALPGPTARGPWPVPIPATWASTSGAGRSSTCWRPPSAARAPAGPRPSPCSALLNGSTPPACAGSGGPASWPPAGNATRTRLPATRISRSSSPTSSIGRRTWSAGSRTSGSGSR